MGRVDSEQSDNPPMPNNVKFPGMPPNKPNVRKCRRGSQHDRLRLRWFAKAEPPYNSTAVRSSMPIGGRCPSHCLTAFDSMGRVDSEQSDNPPMPNNVKFPDMPPNKPNVRKCRRGSQHDRLRLRWFAKAEPPYNSTAVRSFVSKRHNAKNHPSPLRIGWFCCGWSVRGNVWDGVQTPSRVRTC